MPRLYFFSFPRLCFVESSLTIEKKYLNLSGKNGNNTFQNPENLQIPKMYVAKILHPKTTDPEYATHAPTLCDEVSARLRKVIP